MMTKTSGTDRRESWMSTTYIITSSGTRIYRNVPTSRELLHRVSIILCFWYHVWRSFIVPMLYSCGEFMDQHGVL